MVKKSKLLLCIIIFFLSVENTTLNTDIYLLYVIIKSYHNVNKAFLLFEC